LEELLAGPPPENVVEALVGQAYSRLDRLAQQVLQALAVFERPVPPAAIDYLLQPTLPSIDSTPILNRLVNMRFVTKERGRYYMHAVDRAYAIQRLSVAAESGTTPDSLSALQSRAADYFRSTRTPRTEWKSLTDLTAQLAEIDLRVAAGEYDTAADVLSEINFDYLLLWGHTRLLIEQHERLQGKLSDATLKQTSIGNLGTAYSRIGQVRKAIACYEQALTLAREANNRGGEGVWLGGLGNCYGDLGETRRAIELHEQALAIAREIGDTYIEGHYLADLAIALTDERRYAEAIRHAQTSIQIGTTTENLEVCSKGHYALAMAQLGIGDLPSARATAEQSQRYDYRPNIAAALALLGVIAVRQGESAAAHAAFTAARSHAEEALALTPELYRMQDTLALALAGLAEIENARIAYRTARAITSDPGIVRRAAFLLEQVGM
jgi:tetratricopeptide (TPR) repeat protein